MQRSLSALLPVLALLSACSSTTSSGGTAGPSAPATQTIESMSATEAKSYCSEVFAYQTSKVTPDDAKRASCGIGSLFTVIGATSDADAQAKCKAAYDACLAKPSEPADAGPASDPCADFPTKAASCKGSGLTVGEYNACMDEQIASFKLLADPAICNSAKVSGGPTSSAGSPKCDAVKAKCPGLFSSTSTGGPK